MICISLMISEHFFMCVLASCIVAFEKKMSILALCPFLNVICFSAIKLYNSLAYIAYLLDMIWKYFLFFHRLPFLFVDGLFCLAEAIFGIILYYIFVLLFMLLVSYLTIHCQNCQGDFPVFFYEFYGLRSYFKSLINFELIFVSGLR